MEKVIVEFNETDNGYCGRVLILECFICSYPGTFDRFKQYTQESIDQWVECAKEDGDEIPTILNGEYELEFIEINK